MKNQKVILFDMFTTYIFSIIKVKKMNKAAVSPYIECHTKSRDAAARSNHRGFKRNLQIKHECKL